MSNRNDELAQRRAAEVSTYTLHLDRSDIGLMVYTKPAPNPGQILCKGFIGKAGKPTWYYRFRNQTELDNYVNQQITSRTYSIEAKAKAKAEQSAPAEVQVGDVFEACWGYDQTNIDYYQVTKVISDKTVEIRRISSVSWETDYMQGRSVPSLDNFIGAPMRKRIRSCSYGGGAAVRITSFYDAYKMKPVVDGTPIYASSHWTAYA